MNNVEIVNGFAPPKRKSLKIWRYMDLDKFKSLIESKTLYFASAREFDDSFEGSITRRHYEYQLRKSTNGFGIPSDFYHSNASNAFYELTRLTKINCWHINEHESAAMWKLYLADGKGIAIQSTISRLQSALYPFHLKPEYGAETIKIGKVKYIDYKSEVMDDKSMLGRYFYKRKSFSHERELRAVISLRMAEEYGVPIPKKGINVSVDLDKLVSNIYLAPAISHKFNNQITKIIDKNNYDFIINQSELDDKALF